MTLPITSVLASITYSKLRITFEVIDHICFGQEYRGSAFRGSMLRAFMQQECRFRNPKTACSACRFRYDCLYYGFSANELQPGHVLHGRFTNPPEGYIVYPPADGKQEYEPGEKFSFELILFGNMTQLFFPALSAAIGKMGANGMGKDRGRFKAVLLEYANKNNTFRPLPAFALPSELPLAVRSKDKPHERITVQFLSPVQFKGVKPDPGNPPDLHSLLSSVWLRAMTISVIYCGYEGPYVQFPKTSKEAFAFKNSGLKEASFWSHSAQRSKQGISPLKKYSGLTGTITYEGNFDDCFALLKAGEVLQAGSLTTFGMGRYTVN